MSGISGVVPEGKSPKTPGGRKLIQGRLPFAIVDNKTPTKPLAVPKVSEEKTSTKCDEPTTPNNNVTDKEEQTNSNSFVCLDDSSKSLSIIADSDESQSVHSVSVAEEEQGSEMNVSCASQSSLNDQNTATPSAKKMTPKQSEREKKRIEKLKEKEEKEKKRAEEKAEKERIKEAEKRKKEEEKKKKEEEREADKKRKEDERKKKEEEKEAEKKRKEDERKKKEEEKEAEKKKKEDEEKRKKERLSQVFTNFFTQKKTTPAKSDGKPNNEVSLAFPPFQVKENMKLAPTVRVHLDIDKREELDQFIRLEEPKVQVNCQQFKISKRKYGPTWPLNKDAEVEILDEDDAPVNKEDVIIAIDSTVTRRMRAKLLKFDENRRPAYWGTWRKTSQSVGPRRPFEKEAIFDYDVDSDDEWEEEVEPGESLTDSEGEGEEKEPTDDYEVDEFLVPHGYLSDEEGEKDEDERPLSPSAAKEQLKLKEEQFKQELKEKTCQIKPSLIGCCWLGESNQEPQLLKVLQRYAAVVCSSSARLPICLSNSELVCDSGESPMDDAARSEKASKRVVSDADIPALIRLLHGTSYSKFAIVKEFQASMERNRTEDKNSSQGPSKAQIIAKISEIASWTKCTEAGAMNGRTCWIVQPEILERYNLSNLSVVNSWSTEPKKRSRKADETKNEGDTPPPPSKTARVSLMKKFVSKPVVASPSLPIANADCILNSSEPLAQTEPSPITPKGKKRVALISLPSSSTKKPRSETKATPLTSFLKKMGSGKDALLKQSASPDHGDGAMKDDDDCVVLE